MPGELRGDKAQLSQVVRIAQRMGALVIRKIRFPVIMDHRPAERAKNAHRLHRLVAALGMDLIRRQALGAGDMQPMQLPPHPQPRLIHMQHLGGAQQALHRFRGRGNTRLQVLRSLQHRRFAQLALHQVGKKSPSSAPREYGGNW